MMTAAQVERKRSGNAVAYLKPRHEIYREILNWMIVLIGTGFLAWLFLKFW